MGKRTEKISAKGRLDKYYHLAKEQGYRSFKILQIDRQYDFLSRARCLIDLCAAPGSWLQVAAKKMPPGSIIVGVDLVPIRPIDRVTTFAEDITTDACRSKIRNELKDWKADVVAHDGAPNVGSNWLSDAYAQNELVLASLRLATEFLTPGGTFVTKVFRSKDYHSLLWVFNQLFSKVEATKPPASRNVSAEIFVVCLGYLAPKRLDPKLLSAKHVFKDLDLVAPADGAEASTSKAPGNSLNIFGPEKKRRRREGYADGDMTLFRSVPIREFVDSTDPIGVLSNANKLDFGPDDEALLADEHTTPEVRASCADLKVLGKSDFKALLKWRLAIRSALGLVALAEEPETVETAEVVEMDEDEQLQQELERLETAETARRRKERRKTNERKARDALKLQLNMTTNMDLGAERQDGLIELGGLDDDEMLLRDVQLADDSSSEDEAEAPVVPEDAAEDADDEPAPYADALERQFDEQYEEWLSRRDAKDMKKRARDLKRQRDAAQGEWTGIGEGGSDEGAAESDGSLDEDDEDAASDASDAPATAGPSRAAALWYDQPIFKDLGALLPAAPTSVAEPTAPTAPTPAPAPAKAAAADAWSSDDEDSRPSKRPKREDMSIVTAEAMTLAMKLVNREVNKSQLMDSGYNRHMRDVDGLPTWFADDEAKHGPANHIPVTKEAVEAIRAKARALNARPIKKIAEAKARKKMRASRRIQRMQTKAEAVANSADMTEKEKANSIAKLVANAAKAPKRKKAEVKTVVARGANRGIKGRPKGTTGRYRMVDPRQKKELRADKRKAKATKGKSKSGGKSGKRA